MKFKQANNLENQFNKQVKGESEKRAILEIRIIIYMTKIYTQTNTFLYSNTTHENIQHCDPAVGISVRIIQV